MRLCSPDKLPALQLSYQAYTRIANDLERELRELADQEAPK